jgi:transposase
MVMSLYHLKTDGESKMKIALLGIDIAKNVFQLHGTDKQGKTLLQKQLRRAELLTFIVNLPTCTIAMEACATSNY